MAIDLYLMPASGPCRAVLMVGKELGIEFNLKVLDLMKGEQNSPEFVKINPQHCVPTIVDGDFALWESRAILTYLVNKYSPGHELYPSCPKGRARIDRLLYFDIGSLGTAQAAIVYPMIFKNEPIDPEKDKVYKEKLQVLDDILSGNKYVAGCKKSLADISLLASLGICEVVDYDLSSFINITNWMNQLKAELPYYEEVNTAGLAGFKQFVAAKRAAADQPKAD